MSETDFEYLPVNIIARYDAPPLTARPAGFFDPEVEAAMSRIDALYSAADPRRPPRARRRRRGPGAQATS